MILTLNPVTTGGAPSFEAFVKAAAAQGYGGIDYSIDPAQKMAAETSVRAVWEFLAEHRVQLAVFGLPVEFRRDEDTFKRGLAQLPAKAALAREIGTSRCATWIPPTTDQPPAPYALVMARRLAECAKVLGDNGIRLGLEWVAPATSRAGKTPYLWTMEQVLDLGAATGQPNVGLLVDSWHWYTAHGTREQLESLEPEQIVHVHVNDAPQKPVDEQIDNQRLLPGESGVIDLATFFDVLRQKGYIGPVAIETFSATLPKLGLDEAARLAAEATRPFLR